MLHDYTAQVNIGPVIADFMSASPPWPCGDFEQEK